ncbi:OPT/YSL family transporter [Parasphaerochaeta coccoides]|uniref:Oligopeptide transporter OPT superfamily protein n=1 Tax=Parasphaerochaeta coccoides (strain ATCC BAA-1237 / DSM 17374 / SPN1) TaxID=760011 RepID=F4GKC6_PARC1|nr:OPT/YSL family transporter [Parasphaerochaeta coccoides]AEC02322.1 Oligopeptide transporter OPT superfamily protein [Parasphaerochaeta coccoides DSM 17374]
MNRNQLTSRGLVVSFIGLLIITTSSMYVALRMGALPWPTVFVTVISMLALRKAKGVTMQEINVTHTLMDAGAMVAGGLAFTLPGLWILQPDAHISTVTLIAIALSGSLLGTAFTALKRREMIETRKLPFPMGQASHDTLVAGVQGGSVARVLFIAMAGSIVFTILRDSLGLIPAVITIFAGSALIPTLMIWVSPMGAAIGALIGPKYSFVWVAGAVFGYFFLTPLGIMTGLFTDMAAADLFRSNLGIGFMVGTGIGIFLKAIVSRFKEILSRDKTRARWPSVDPGTARTVSLLIVAVILLLAFFTDLSFLHIIVLLAGTYISTSLSATLTGQTGINPMEIFGILVLLVVSAIWSPSLAIAFTVATVTTVACGMTGDVMNDLKSGSLLGTDSTTQQFAQAIGSLAGAVIAVFVLLVMKDAFGNFGTAELPAPQASAVAAMAGGLGNVPAFLIGAVGGILLYIFNVPAATFGLGIYLPVYISAIVGIGTLIMSICRKTFAHKMSDADITSTGTILSSGLLGGEGITGVVIAIISMFG